MTDAVIKYWCDSGANAQSCYRSEITLRELGITIEEWREMSDDDRDEMMRECAFERMDWGYKLEDEND